MLVKAVFGFLLWVLVFRQCIGFTLKTESASPQDQIDAVKGLITRMVGANVLPKFNFEIITNAGNDVFEIESVSNIITFRGTTGVALSSAFNRYLNYYTNSSISWGRDGSGDNLVLPSPLPQVPSKLRVESPVKYRYYMNVCTVSYSSAWWDWSRWEREIDWMAMNGYNLILSFTGQEYIESEVYKSFGLTTEDIAEQFSGPAFHAWERMGNIRAWGGPLDQDWQLGQYQLQQQILQRQKSFGMISVLPGFAGHVPKGLSRIFPSANITRSPNWGGFPDPYCCDYLLAPVDPLFEKIGTAFVQKQIEAFGFTDHIYNADTFNEMRPASNDPTYLANTAKAVLQAMKGGDPDAKWLMQGWLFQDSGFWTPQTIRAYLGGVSNDDMIILDLYSDESPVYSKTQSYFGKDFIWCMLHNFGGTRGIYGLIDHIATNPIDVKNTVGYTMIGTGITMEAIEQNPIIYTLMSEMGWRSTKFDTTQWIEFYAERRYGSLTPSLKSAWAALHKGAYSYPWDWSLKSLVERRPNFSMSSYQALNATLIVDAWRYFIASKNELSNYNGPWLYDMVDLTRQILSNFFVDVHGLFAASYNRQDIANSQTTGNSLLDIIKNLDDILGTNPNYLLGNWLEDAKKWAKTDDERKLYEFNARNQITLWGPSGQITDYASKPWAGLYSDYYFERWNFFINSVWDSLKNKQPFDQTTYDQKILLLEQAWGEKNTIYPTQATNNTINVVTTILEKYATSNSQYKILQNTDAGGNDIYRAWTRDIQQMKILCDLDTECKGFNSNGYLKMAVETTGSSVGCDLYIKS